MIRELYIKDFKNISETTLPMRPLTIITGKNSTGKSSVLQAVLLSQLNSRYRSHYDSCICQNYETIRNKYGNAKQIDIRITSDDESGSFSLSIDGDGFIAEGKPFLSLEENLYYLSANRLGAENVVTVIADKAVGPSGEQLFATFETEKSMPVASELVRDPDSYTLSAQINYWLSYILDSRIELNSEMRSSQRVEISYSSDGLNGVLPSMLGAGVSYLAKILILCLRTHAGDVVMIENPGIHLYPTAQSRLGEFFAFLSRNRRQIIVETHCNDLITRIRYEIFKGRLNPEDAVIMYKGGVTEPFKILTVDRNGQFSEPFPETFFDATLSELLAMD